MSATVTDTMNKPKPLRGASLDDAVANDATDTEQWPKPSPLGDELPPVMPFDLDLLPVSLQPLVLDVSERMQTPLDYAAVACVAALGGCANRRVVVYPKKRDTSWAVVPNLWGGIVAPPGMMKSPVVLAVTRPLYNIEEKWRAEYDSELSDFLDEKEDAELRHQAWREEYKRAIKKGNELPIQPDTSLRQPTRKRLVLTDATVEKLHEILSENPAGVFVVRDELTGWLAELERQGREGERAFFLQAWNGDSGFTVDRIGRGSIYVPAVCVSLFGNIQPSRLRWYLSDAITGGPADDGLFQRFQVLVWPDLPRNWKCVDQPPDDWALEIAERTFSTLTHLSADDPVRLRFTADAQALFFAWWKELEKNLRGASSLAPPVVAHLAKYRSLMPSLAGLFELADCVAVGEEIGGQLGISLDHAKQAAAFCDYLESHARRIYSCIVSPETRAARDLARRIHARDLPDTFKTRDVYLKGWTGLDSPDRARMALDVLEDAYWVRREPSIASRTGGRPPEVWNVNPKVFHECKK